MISDYGICNFARVGVHLNKCCDENQRFDEMKSKIAEILLASLGTLLFLFLILPFFFIWIPYKILSPPNYIYLFDIGVFRYCGWIPIVLGVVIYFWCSLSFLFIGKGTPLIVTPPKNLVVKGLYRFVRNPMYIGALLIVLGEALLFQSKGLFIYALVMLVPISVYLPLKNPIWQINLEELTNGIASRCVAGFLV